MSRGLLFAGTSDGRQLAKQLSEAGIELVVRVATEYGEQLLNGEKPFEVLSGRLNQEEMTAFLQTAEAAGKGFDFVVDATHPFAEEVSVNIRRAVAEWNLKNVGKSCRYFRLLRERESCANVVFVNSAAEAAAYLKDKTGAILLTTGSKNLESFTEISDYTERCYLRVLPCVSSISKCSQLGFLPSHIIAMQGPFSEQLNLALLYEYHIRYLVMKESGKAGGFPEKMSAAQKAEVTPIVIQRPIETKGNFSEELFKIICEQFCV